MLDVIDWAMFYLLFMNANSPMAVNTTNITTNSACESCNINICPLPNINPFTLE
jgi:hypothetical protein